MAQHEWKKKLYYLTKKTRWSQGIGAELPEEYQKFWKEWHLDKPAPVHEIHKEGNFEKKPWGAILPIQNVPIPLKFPKEMNTGIWGGEAVVQGFVKKHKYRRRVVRFWVPNLLKSVVYSEILNKYIKTIVTHRTLDLIHENYGFDHYVLKTKACDLKSLLALQLKRQILIELWDKTLYPDDPVKRDEVYAKYEHYLAKYTRKEIEWYGLTWKEACNKILQQKTDGYQSVPLKIKLREQLIQKLKDEKSLEVEAKEEESKQSWLSKMNPFGKRNNETTA